MNTDFHYHNAVQVLVPILLTFIDLNHWIISKTITVKMKFGSAAK